MATSRPALRDDGSPFLQSSLIASPGWSMAMQLKTIGTHRPVHFYQEIVQVCFTLMLTSIQVKLHAGTLALTTGLSFNMSKAFRISQTFSSQLINVINRHETAVQPNRRKSPKKEEQIITLL